MSLIWLPRRPVGISAAVEQFVMVQDHIQHLRRKAAFGGERVIAAPRMLADRDPFLVGERARLVQDRSRNEGLADIVQQRGAGQTALVVLAHAEMLREGNGEAGDKEAMAIAAGMMAADGRSANHAMRNA